jgi:hypothetical protein
MSLSKEIKESLWDFYGCDSFSRLHDCLIEFYDDVTEDHVYKLFLMLPDFIIGLGISWSFNDTEVGDAVYSFIETNTEMVDTLFKD